MYELELCILHTLVATMHTLEYYIIFYHELNLVVSVADHRSSIISRSVDLLDSISPISSLPKLFP